MRMNRTYLDTLSGANDMSAEPLTKSPIIPFHSARNKNGKHMLVKRDGGLG